jgi:hypothetical protein
MAHGELRENRGIQATRSGSLEHHTDVGVLTVQSRQPLGLFGPGEVGCGPLHQAEVELGVPAPGLSSLAARRELL